MGRKRICDKCKTHWHVAVLVLLLALAILGWYAWPTYGAIPVHRRFLQQTSGATAATSPSDESKVGNDLAALGQTGDSFGSFNALLTAIGGVVVFWAGLVQYLALQQARKQAEEERSARKLQEFEALFFRLLELSNEITNRIEIRPQSTKSSASPSEDVSLRRSRKGPAALASLAMTLHNRSSPIRSSDCQNLKKELEVLVKTFLIGVLDGQPSSLGPYFRILYQTFQHISESHLSDEAQIKYANIARGQINEGAALLLAVNGLTADGHHFVPLIEKFGLLEHLHRRYKMEYQEILRVGYRDRAFMGSEERAKPENKFVSAPKLCRDHFSHLETGRGNQDLELKFVEGHSGDSDEGQ